ncbi:hypothetical protein [Streptomyces sp. NBC_00328]|uniref:hypothetical protein n=1 Tax=Streptomyces sp. NBC_00328 TaxID=2903646 RepID=UPI002E291716|nr:hypothetical protein [Streptomyces sp. NBC_00328]
MPAIDGVDRLPAWWLTEVRPQFGDEPAGGQAVLLPSRRHTLEGGRHPACAVTLRDGDQRPEPVPLGLRSAARPWIGLGHPHAGYRRGCGESQ